MAPLMRSGFQYPLGSKICAGYIFIISSNCFAERAALPTRIITMRSFLGTRANPLAVTSVS